MGGTQHGVLFGAVLSRRNRPSDGWGSWLLVPLRMCCAPTTHSHTPIAAHKRASREREKEELAGASSRCRPAQMMSSPPPSFSSSLCYSHPGALCGGTRIADRYIYLYTSPLLYINTCIREWKASRETQSTNLNHPRLHSLSFSFS